MATQQDTCDNCGRAIGRLERACVWQDHVVCANCHSILIAQADAYEPEPEPDTAPLMPVESYDAQDPNSDLSELSANLPQQSPRSRRQAPARRSRQQHSRLTGPFMRCNNPNCGYCGPTVKRSRGSMLVFFLLLLLGALPGILYMIFASGYEYVCPNCNITLGQKMG